MVSTLHTFVKMFGRAHEDNCKQVELDKKRAQKEAGMEKMKLSTPKKEIEHNMPISSNTRSSMEINQSNQRWNLLRVSCHKHWIFSFTLIIIIIITMLYILYTFAFSAFFCIYVLIKCICIWSLCRWKCLFLPLLLFPNVTNFFLCYLFVPCTVYVIIKRIIIYRWKMTCEFYLFIYLFFRNI